MDRAVRKITQVRTEYTSARIIATNLEHRLAGTKWQRPPGYMPPEIDYTTLDGVSRTIAVRDYDARYLDRVPPSKALDCLNLIHCARLGDPAARAELAWRTAETQRLISGRFLGAALVESEYVIPYTTTASFPDSRVSNKGGILLDLSRRGFATADFAILSSAVYGLPAEEREARLWEAIRNLEILSGRTLADPDNPLLIAVRSAMPEYMPGFMPTYLNAGLTPELLPGLPPRYGEEAAARIRLNSRKTILEALEPETFRLIENDIRPEMTIDQNLDLARKIEALIENRNPKLLWSAREQVKFFLSRIYDYYERHLDSLRNFMIRETHFPAVIVQRMVCSVIDRKSYAGVLYSHHPRLGSGVFLQFARAVYGEDLMTGRLQPEEKHFRTREDARRDFPAVYHFWHRLGQLEAIFRAPVMVEFTGVHGTFTILQVNPAEMVGAGMLTAVMDMHRAGKIPAERVRELIRPYHVRQTESDAIDSKSLHALTPFCRGISVLPRAAVTGRIFFSAERVDQARDEKNRDNVILAKDRFAPMDAVDMQKVGGILSLSPAAIHVVTTAQNLGIPALLNLEESGVRLDPEKRVLINRDKMLIKEGDWVSISSRLGTLYLGKAVFAPARLLRFMAGEKVELTPGEKTRFEKLAEYYREYRGVVESVDATEFESLQDLGHAIRYGRLQGDRLKAEDFVNRSFDINLDKIVARTMDATLGTHLINKTAFNLLTLSRKVNLLKSALTESARRGISGYRAGAFLIGCLVDPGARIAFWKNFSAGETARLIDEWVLHQKYLKILDDLGERRVSRAKDVILSRGLGFLSIHRGLAADFMTLKLSGVDLARVRREVGDGFDPQTAEILDLLLRPYGEFYDFSDERSLAGLRKICAEEGRALPAVQDI
jgi:hypothetical protein